MGSGVSACCIAIALVDESEMRERLWVGWWVGEMGRALGFGFFLKTGGTLVEKWERGV